MQISGVQTSSGESPVQAFPSFTLNASIVHPALKSSHHRANQSSGESLIQAFPSSTLNASIVHPAP